MDPLEMVATEERVGLAVPEDLEEGLVLHRCTKCHHKIHTLTLSRRSPQDCCTLLELNHNLSNSTIRQLLLM
jgi:hypothetical protein